METICWFDMEWPKSKMLSISSYWRVEMCACIEADRQCDLLPHCVLAPSTGLCHACIEADRQCDLLPHCVPAPSTGLCRACIEADRQCDLLPHCVLAPSTGLCRACIEADRQCDLLPHCVLAPSTGLCHACIEADRQCDLLPHCVLAPSTGLCHACIEADRQCDLLPHCVLAPSTGLCRGCRPSWSYYLASSPSSSTGFQSVTSCSSGVSLNWIILINGNIVIYIMLFYCLCNIHPIVHYIILIISNCPNCMYMYYVRMYCGYIVWLRNLGLFCTKALTSSQRSYAPQTPSQTMSYSTTYPGCHQT